jgi:hypothetical protein
MAMLVGAMGCEELGTAATLPTSPDVNEEQKPSGIALSLVATDSQGRTYRLRDASFVITPYYWWSADGGVPSPQTLSTETHPEATRMSVRLLPGEYVVALQGNWYIERVTANGVERVQKVVLLSQQTQYAYVSDGWYANVEFRFGVDGDLIDFRHGDLHVDVVVELPGDRSGFDAGTSYPYGDAGLDAGL